LEANPSRIDRTDDRRDKLTLRGNASRDVTLLGTRIPNSKMNAEANSLPPRATA
jgi:hypothetical protein